MTDIGDWTTIREDPERRGAAEPRVLLRQLPLGSAQGLSVTELSRGEPLLVGRKPGPGGFAVMDLKMSRTHFSVRWDPGNEAYRIADEDSRNGTYLNGRPLREATLRPQDVVRAGDSLFVCHTEEAGEVDYPAWAARSDVPLLIVGETGTGKDHLARRLHELSGRGPWVPINCGALPRELIASELFGHVRGAFSGATASRPGLFASAHGGTLFLDEVCELPLELQPALLRALEGGHVRPVGAERETTVEVRVIAATNRDPEAAVRDGRFRADLHARLAGVVLHLEPLRCHRHRLPDTLASIAREAKVTVACSADALEAILLWDFPYNVRELKTLVRAVASAERISLDDLRALRPELAVQFEQRRAGHVAAADAALVEITAGAHAEPRGKGAARDEADLVRLVAALRRHDGHLGKAASEASISRQRAQRLLRQFPSRDPRCVR
jgi:transcriptional regulator with GAF, ATPase, and Fis domain